MKIISAMVRIDGLTKSIQCEGSDQEKFDKRQFETDPLYLLDVELPYWEQQKKRCEWHIARVKHLFAQCTDSVH